MSEIFNFLTGPVEENVGTDDANTPAGFQRVAQIVVGRPYTSGDRTTIHVLAGDSMLVSSKRSAMLCPSIPHRSTRLKSRILSKGQFIALTTPSTPGTLAPVSFTRTSLKGLGQQQQARVPSSTELGMASPAHPSIRLLSRLHASFTPSGSSAPK
jgi:hypothetical protein